MKNFLEKRGAALITVVALIVVTSAMVAAVYYFIEGALKSLASRKNIRQPGKRPLVVWMFLPKRFFQWLSVALP